jgi:trehalose-6-phosphate synthase
MLLAAYGFLATPKGGSSPMAELVVASNRGPVQFEVDDDGNLTAGRGAGGMVAALGPALAG